ncbi:MAG: ISKra4 family transposase, partial [Pseudanabaena sp.]
QMLYVEAISSNLPIGSGITEAACKVIIKARLGCSGMKWKDWGASVVLSLRALSYTKGRWQQFWSKISRYGFSL